MYRPEQIADYFLSKYSKEGNITPMKLIKLVYIAHGWHLGITGNALIDENPEAWKYGPVIPNLYHKYKHYRNSAIIADNPEYSLGNEELEVFLNKIWEVYGGFDGTQLSAKTHQVGSPWYKTWNNIEFSYLPSLQIPETDIREHYKALVDKNKTL